MAVAASAAACGDPSVTGTSLEPPQTTTAPAETTTTQPATQTTTAPAEATTTQPAGLSDGNGDASATRAQEGELPGAVDVPAPRAPATDGEAVGADATEDPPSASALEPVTATSSPAAAVSDDVPDLAMVDVATGATVQVRSLVTGETPLLLWFWSPY